jgi:2-oxoglutarate ferredoxin oxidoreductase subunit alpha
MVIEAVRIATRHMVPVVYLSDGSLANCSEPWRLPDVEKFASIAVPSRTDAAGFQPYLRDPETLARPWALPGTPGLEHRIGGLEKQDVTGNVSYDARNHEHMTRVRQEKVDRIARTLPPAETFGEPEGDLLVVGWGGTFGSLRQAVQILQREGRRVSHLHLRYLNPLQSNVGDLVRAFRRVLVPELNSGQLRMILRARFLVDAAGLNKVQGQPFKVREVLEAARALLAGESLREMTL